MRVLLIDDVMRVFIQFLAACDIGLMCHYVCLACAPQLQTDAQLEVCPSSDNLTPTNTSRTWH